MEKGKDVQGYKYRKRCPSMERSIKHYSNFHQILLVGEGDFSFSLALANAFGSAENMVTTSLDSRETVIRSYKSVHGTLSKLERLGATILHGIDATTMEKHHIIRKRSFHRIVYNFPHAGFYGKEEDKRVIKKHRHLLKMFFKNSRTMLNEEGEIHVTHKEKYPYNMWKLVKQAEKYGLILKESVRFSKGDYPGYTNRRGAGEHPGDTFFLGECQTYKFFLSRAIFHERELMATAGVLPEFSSGLSVENFEALSLELKSERQARKAAEKDFEALILELKSERQARQAAEKDFEALILELKSERTTRKTAEKDVEVVLNHMKVIADEDIKKRAELVRQRKDALRQKAQAWREKENIGKQLDEALKSSNKDEIDNIGKQLDEAFKSNKDEIKRKESSLKEAILEIEFEKQERKNVETEKADLESSCSHLKMLLENEQNKNDELKKQRDEALYQMEEACREKTDVAKQLDEALAENFKAIIAEVESERHGRPLKRKRRVWRLDSIA